jgi:hypothetical protein
MLLSPVFMGVSAALITWRPTVAMLSVRRFLMPLSSTPWRVAVLHFNPSRI